MSSRHRVHNSFTSLDKSHAQRLQLASTKVTFLAELLEDVRTSVKQLSGREKRLTEQKEYYERNWRKLIDQHVSATRTQVHSQVRTLKAAAADAEKLISHGRRGQLDAALLDKHIKSLRSTISTARPLIPFDPFGTKQITALQKDNELLRESNEHLRQEQAVSSSSSSSSQHPSSSSSSALRSGPHAATATADVEALLRENEELRDMVADMEVERVKREQVVAETMGELKRNQQDWEREERRRVTEMYEGKKNWASRIEEAREEEKALWLGREQQLRGEVAGLKEDRDKMREDFRQRGIAMEHDMAKLEDDLLQAWRSDEHGRQQRMIAAHELVVGQLKSEITRIEREREVDVMERNEEDAATKFITTKVRRLELEKKEDSAKLERLKNETHRLRTWIEDDRDSEKSARQSQSSELKRYMASVRGQFRRKVLYGIAQVVKRYSHVLTKVCDVLSVKDIEQSKTAIRQLKTSIFHLNPAEASHEDHTMAALSRSVFGGDEGSGVSSEGSSRRPSASTIHSQDTWREGKRGSGRADDITIEPSVFDFDLDVLDFDALDDATVADFKLNLRPHKHSTHVTRDSSMQEGVLIRAELDVHGVEELKQEFEGMLNSAYLLSREYVSMYQAQNQSQSQRYKNMLLKIHRQHVAKVKQEAVKTKTLAVELKAMRQKLQTSEAKVERMRLSLEGKTTEVQELMAKNASSLSPSSSSSTENNTHLIEQVNKMASEIAGFQVRLVQARQEASEAVHKQLSSRIADMMQVASKQAVQIEMLSSTLEQSNSKLNASKQRREEQQTELELLQESMAKQAEDHKAAMQTAVQAIMEKQQSVISALELKTFEATKARDEAAAREAIKDKRILQQQEGLEAGNLALERAVEDGAAVVVRANELANERFAEATGQLSTQIVQLTSQTELLQGQLNSKQRELTQQSIALDKLTTESKATAESLTVQLVHLQAVSDAAVEQLRARVVELEGEAAALRVQAPPMDIQIPVIVTECKHDDKGKLQAQLSSQATTIKALQDALENGAGAGGKKRSRRRATPPHDGDQQEDECNISDMLNASAKEEEKEAHVSTVESSSDEEEEDDEPDLDVGRGALRQVQDMMNQSFHDIRGELSSLRTELQGGQDPWRQARGSLAWGEDGGVYTEFQVVGPTHTTVHITDEGKLSLLNPLADVEGVSGSLDESTSSSEGSSAASTPQKAVVPPLSGDGKDEEEEKEVRDARVDESPSSGPASEPPPTHTLE